MPSACAIRLGIVADPTPLRLLGEAGYYWLTLGHPAEALEVFAGLAVLAPDDPTPWMGMGDARLAAGESDLAIALYERAGESPRIDARTLAATLRKRGVALLGLGRVDEAEFAWDRAAALDPHGDEGRAATDLRESLRAIRDGSGAT